MSGALARATLGCMTTALKARVRAGRLIVDEPTDLPDGTELELVVADDLQLSERDREEIDGLIAQGLADVRAGRTVPAEDVIREVAAMEPG